MFNPMRAPRLLLPFWLLLSLSFLGSLACQSEHSAKTKTPSPATENSLSQLENKGPEAQNDIKSLEPIEELSAVPVEAPLLRLAIIADMNGRYGSTEYAPEVIQALDRIIEERPDIVINAGDMVAGQRAKLDYRSMWASFHSHVTDRLKAAQIPMAQTVGNHDGSAYPPYANEREIYIDEWSKRKPELDYVDDSHYPLYYSFLFKELLFISLDASTLEALDDEQYQWLERQLAKNPSPHAPIVFGHVPLYPITTIKPTEILRDPRLHPLFVKYRVQLMITGHQQAYFPAKLDGITYLHAGALGGGPRPVRQNAGIEPKTLTFIEIYPKHSPRIDTQLIGPGRIQRFNHNYLPTYIAFDDQILPRVDIDIEDARYAQKYFISPHMARAQMLALIQALRANAGDWSKTPSWPEARLP